MRGRRLPALALVLMSAAPAGAACVERPSRVVEAEINGCRPAEIAIEEQVAGTRIWWLRPYLLSIARANPGVLLRLRVRRASEFDPPESVGPWRDDGGEAEFFFGSSDGALCDAFAGVEEALFLAEPPCCDVIPPVSVACLLETDELRPVFPFLLDRLELLEELEAGDDEGR